MNLSLVDCASFVLMRRLAAQTVLSVDGHFVEHGFTVVPKVSWGRAGE